MDIETYFWARLVLAPGKSRAIGLNNLFTWRPDLAYDDDPDHVWCIWPFNVDDNGEIAFTVFSGDFWDSVHVSRIVPGATFRLVEGKMHVANGTVTRVIRKPKCE